LINFKETISAGRFYFPWHETIIQTRTFLNNELYVIHPALTKIFYDFKANYNKFRLIDMPTLRNSMPLTIDEFTSLVEAQVAANKGLLATNWLNECSNTISSWKESIEVIIHSRDDVIITYYIDA
jgi:dynein heavy chain